MDDFGKFMARFTKKLEKAVNTDAPKRAGQVAVRMFKQNFKEEGFFGDKWKDVKRRTNPPKPRKGKKGKKAGKGKKAASKRPILTGPTGNLGRSIHYEAGHGEVTIISDLPYSAVHNEGLRAGRGKGFQMPRRQFIGDHDKLSKAVAEAIQKEIIDKMKR